MVWDCHEASNYDGSTWQKKTTHSWTKSKRENEEGAEDPTIPLTGAPPMT
jgi:hypothetical protein